jgi:hypothetical protein
MWDISAVTWLGDRGKAGNILGLQSLGGVVSEIAVTELGYVGLGVSDLSRWRVLAGDVLGMECVEAGDNLHLRNHWNCRIRLHPDAPSITVSVAACAGWTGPMIRSIKSAERTLRLLGLFSRRQQLLPVQSAPLEAGGS